MKDGRDLRRSWLPWIPLAIVFAIALAVGTAGATGPTTNADRVVEITKTIKCPFCDGETVAESNVDISRVIRVDVAERVQKGQTDEDIRAFYANRYGDDHILLPTSSGVTGLVWITPVVALVVSLAGLALVFRRWGERVPEHASDADRDLVARAQADRAAADDTEGEDEDDEPGDDEPDDDAEDDDGPEDGSSDDDEPDPT